MEGSGGLEPDLQMHFTSISLDLQCKVPELLQLIEMT